MFKAEALRNLFAGTVGNPAGNIMKELSESEIDNVAGAGTAESYCACYSGEDSCGSVCTGTTECPLVFSLFGCCG